MMRAVGACLAAVAVLVAVVLCCAPAATTALRPSLQPRSAAGQAHAAPIDEPPAVKGKSFSVYSGPTKLGFGQVHNDLDKPTPLPEHIVELLKEGDLVVNAFQADVIEFTEDGEPIDASVPLYDCYLHHYGAFIGESKYLQKFYEMLHPSANSETELQLGPQVAYYGAQSLRSLPMKPMHNLFQEFSKKHGAQTSSFGGGSGAEERQTKHVYSKPYGPVFGKGTDSFMPLMHLINTRGDVEPGTVYSKKAECPCSSDRVFNLTAGTIDGRRPNIPFGCNLQLQMEGNTGCSLDTYLNGFRCCEHGWYVSEPEERVDRPEAQFGMKFTFHYEPATQETIPLRASGCCDATGSIAQAGQIEYDIPQCKPGEECVHTLVTHQFIDVGQGAFGPNPSEEDKKAIAAGAEIDLITLVGHQHLGASPLGIKLYQASTDELLCDSRPIFGNGIEAGNENGYLVGMSSCFFGVDGRLPPRLRRDAVVRIESTYNNTEPHYGVMSLFLISVADVPMKADNLALA